MRNTFFEYNMRGSQKIEQILSNGLIILDTNALLNLYRYNEENKNKFFEILSKVNDRIYLTNYSVKEFYKNRLKILYNKAQFKDAMKKFICKEINTMRNIIENVNFTGDSKDICNLLKYENNLKTSMLEEINFFDISMEDVIESYNQSNLITDLEGMDSILEKILDLFEDRVNQEFSENELEEIYKEGKKRYKSKIPPGYKDMKNKEEPGCYGDLVIWKEIINISKKMNKDILFVSDDRKEDWCYKFNGKDLGPREELIKELFCETGNLFYSFKVVDFIKEISRIYNITDVNKLEKESKLFEEDLYESEKSIQNRQGMFTIEIPIDKQKEFSESKRNQSIAKTSRSPIRYVLRREIEVINEKDKIK
ncbi:hypothetical protein DFW26_15225 [Clostridioides difficile]|uniref:PIN-like domain-containing protein n=1 Tax=Clostridioides difficile TaxID=1496 RepID=UPI0003B299A3|nr:PIN-like domain-containing protein [Clostridioides difficile]EGT4600796.1 hypothetical protein [Clostridioides difficile]MDI7814963.1 PIN domain-containing protein [Clostridioides difficile]CCL06416.1 conserved hypothetical protein [Clostridioides difficile CD002]HBF9421713.1 DUF4935 domain-containing protein [Clostridioides difficile]HBF9842462.1 DUF4935 domain-containing protein [Clostridioides difficile]